MPRYILENGVRRQMTDAEEAARDAEETAWTNGAADRAASEAREKRNSLLGETDYFALTDVALSAEMTTYRQALRDVTSQSGFPTDVTWPQKP